MPPSADRRALPLSRHRSFWFGLATICLALLVLWATSLAVAVYAVPLVAPAEATLAGLGVRTFAGAGAPLSPEIAGAHLYILPTAALAVVALALTTPTVVRLVRRTFLG